MTNQFYKSAAIATAEKEYGRALAQMEYAESMYAAAQEELNMANEKVASESKKEDTFINKLAKINPHVVEKLAGKSLLHTPIKDLTGQDFRDAANEAGNSYINWAKGVHDGAVTAAETAKKDIDYLSAKGRIGVKGFQDAYTGSNIPDLRDSHYAPHTGIAPDADLAFHNEPHTGISADADLAFHNEPHTGISADADLAFHNEGHPIEDLDFEDFTNKGHSIIGNLASNTPFLAATGVGAGLGGYIGNRVSKNKAVGTAVGSGVGAGLGGAGMLAWQNKDKLINAAQNIANQYIG